MACRAFYSFANDVIIGTTRDDFFIPFFPDIIKSTSCFYFLTGGLSFRVYFLGVSSNERAEPLRLKVFNIKKRQLDELNVTTLVTACSNCRTMLEEGMEENDMDISVVGITEIIADHLA